MKNHFNIKSITVKGAIFIASQVSYENSSKFDTRTEI